MTQDEVIEMARDAGGSDVGGPGWTTWVGTQSTEFLERFARLVAAKEREAILPLLKGIDETEIESADGWWETSTGAAIGAKILSTIRARGQA